jgi:spondin N
MRPTPRILAGAMALTMLAAACSNDDEPVAEPDAVDETVDDEMVDEEEEMVDEEVVDEEMVDEEMVDEEMMDGPHTFRVTVTNTSGDFPVAASGAQAIPIGGDEPGPALPGSGYEFTVPRSATNLSFASMFVQSNDWFWSPGPVGLALTDADGSPIAGDVTDQIGLWDAGTEADQTPGEGADQAPRQAGPDTGAADPDSTLRAVDGFDAASYVTVTLAPNEDGSTTVRIENISGAAAVPGPLAPVAWAVHDEDVTFFMPGESAPEGFEMLAEDGSPAGVVEALSGLTGTATPFAPVAWVVSDSTDVFFTPGGSASAGLEGLAEDGGPGGLVDEVMTAGYENSGAATNPDDGDEAGPAFPGSSYTFEFTAEGGNLSLASMFVQSNDWFVSLIDFPLYTDGVAASGDITDQLRLYDAGTEADQAIGAGADQAPRQAGPNTGAADANTEIRAVDVDLAGHLTVTIETVA